MYHYSLAITGLIIIFRYTERWILYNNALPQSNRKIIRAWNMVLNVSSFNYIQISPMFLIC